MPPLLSQSYSNTESSTKTALSIPFVGESTQSTFWSRPPRPRPVVSTRKRLRKTDSVFTKQSSVSSFNMYWVLVPRAQGVLESVVFKTLFVFVALRYPCTYFHNFLTVALKKKKIPLLEFEELLMLLGESYANISQWNMLISSVKWWSKQKCKHFRITEARWYIISIRAWVFYLCTYALWNTLMYIPSALKEISIKNCVNFGGEILVIEKSLSLLFNSFFYSRQINESFFKNV